MKCEWCGDEEKPLTHECVICQSLFCCYEHARQHYIYTTKHEPPAKAIEEIEENA